MPVPRALQGKAAPFGVPTQEAALRAVKIGCPIDGCGAVAPSSAYPSYLLQPAMAGGIVLGGLRSSPRSARVSSTP